MELGHRRGVETHHASAGWSGRQLLPAYELSCKNGAEVWFTDNETNTQSLFNQPLQSPYKDAFHCYLIDGDEDAINPQQIGSKSAFHLDQLIESGKSWTVDATPTIRSREAHGTLRPAAVRSAPGAASGRVAEFLHRVAPGLGEDDRRIRRRRRWPLLGPSVLQLVRSSLAGRRHHGTKATRRTLADRTVLLAEHESQRHHLDADTGEHLYFCQWDLMLHAVAFAEYDPHEARRQAGILRTHNYTATNGQSPAYEWSLSDPNPPIGAWATLRIHQIEKKREATASLDNLASDYRKLLLDYGWWANRTDLNKDSMFDGGTSVSTTLRF